MRIATFCVVLLTAGLLAQGPTPPGSGARGGVLDGTSDKTLDTSASAILRSLSESDRARFVDCLQLLAELSPDRATMRERVHGRSAREVLGLYAEMIGEYDADGDGRLSARERRKMRDGLERARRSANESAAIATLLSLAAAQEQVRAMGVIDVDGDGHGEYGFLGELTGQVSIRDERGRPGTARLREPIVPPSLKVSRGRAARSGYHFRVFLPGSEGPVAEGSRGGVGRVAPEPARAAKAWCAYAWPVQHGVTGARVFFVGLDGAVLQCKKGYSGNRAPRATAALPRGVKTLGEQRAGKRIGNDGSVWDAAQ